MQSTLLAVLCACGATIVADEVPDPNPYRAHALAVVGDAQRGKVVYEREIVGCVRCHTVGSGERKAGPDLVGMADKHARAGLIEAILAPSKSILAGYAAKEFVTTAGEAITGIVKSRADDSVELFLVDGTTRRIAKDDVAEEKNSPLSLMPKDLHASFSKSEFADLLAYLETLKSPEVAPHAKAGTPDDIPWVERPIHIEPFHGESLRFRHPIWFAPVPGIEDTFVVVENDPAKIWLLEKHGAVAVKTLFADLSADACTGEHKGLMGLAFHPQFTENRRYFLNHHVLEDGAFGTVIVERRATEDLRRDAGAPSRRLLHIEQWTDLHTGGMAGFGPDGFLYVGTGDGGPQEDPDGHGQSLHHLLGAVLRIDVDGRDSGLAYAIPRSNPFYGHTDPRVRQEIWAFGFRQAWRFSWDARTGDLWVGDVGQVRFEEITVARAGENHGWNVYEGFLPFSDRYKAAGASHVPPVVALGRKHGASVTGGYVYRGKRSSTYDGVYIFGDYESKRMWGLRAKDRKLEKIRQIGTAPDRITTFAVDREGEIYFCGYDQGMVYRIVLDQSVFE